MKKDWIYVLLGAGAVAAGVAGYLLFKKQSKEVPVKEDRQDSREDTFPSHTSDRENQNDRREILRQRSAAQMVPAAGSVSKESAPTETSASPNGASEGDVIQPVVCVSAPEEPISSLPETASPVECTHTDNTRQEESDSQDRGEEEEGEKVI